MSYANIVIPFIGGLGMFIYGMQIMAQGLENAAGNRMKNLLEVLTKNKLKGVLLGAGITAIIQSSSATTVMVVGFVNAGIMNLTQAIGVIMGANIGTTVTGWLVSSVEWAKFLSPGMLAPVAIMVGVVMMLTGRRRSTKEIASIVVGFGLLFVGITTMSSAVEPLQQSEGFRSVFTSMGSNPLLGILAGTLVTAIIQSSSASVGILQSLAATGLVPFNAAIYIIMGQNIGTCITAILSSIGAKRTAKTAAIMHLLFNVIGTIIFSIVAVIYFKLVNVVLGESLINQTEISMAHTAFNICTTILLFPASNAIIKLAKKIGRVEDEVQDEGQVLLDERMLETPSIAINSTVNEVLRMGQIVGGIMDVSRKVLFHHKTEEIRFIKDGEDVVDKLSAGITAYAIKLSALSIGEKEHQHLARLLQVVSDIERISDYCENLSESATAVQERKLAFSDAAARQMKEMLEVCADSFRYAMEAFAEGDSMKARKVIELETQADSLEISMRASHIRRLTHHDCEPEVGVVFLDALVCLERISDHARNIAEEVLNQEMNS